MTDVKGEAERLESLAHGSLVAALTTLPPGSSASDAPEAIFEVKTFTST